MLNQSSMDVRNWLFYREAAKAEDYTVLEARLAHILPDLRRLYANGAPGELCPDGQPSGVFVEMVLVADKPFIRHVWCACFLKILNLQHTFSTIERLAVDSQSCAKRYVNCARCCVT